MSPASTQGLAENVPTTATGIPIRNLWYMLLYAWNEVALKDHWQADIEAAPGLDALLASILTNLVRQRLRIGLGRSYTEEARLFRGIRGRVNFAESLKRLAFENGQAHCRFQTYSHNVPRNQIVRSTLARLVQTGQFGTDRKRADEIRHKMRRLVRDLDGVDLVEVKVDFIRRQQLGRNDADYRVMLTICDLLLQRQMPTETAGINKLPGLDRDALTLHRIYERFVANFYKLRLAGWTVTGQMPLSWHAVKKSNYMPAMSADLVMQHESTGRMAVLDTKFTANSLIPTRWGNFVFDSSHLYQLYAYLRTQEHLSDSHRCASGILLYPAVRNELLETVKLQGHQIHLATIDLSQSWGKIENDLLNIVSPLEKNPSCF
jgi:5-methylcytosine-specific restriction enzyme subunit McrC